MHFSFKPSDIVSRVMSFGASTPIEVAINSPDFSKTRAFAQQIEKELKQIPSLRDLQFGQQLDYPAVKVEIDRRLAGSSASPRIRLESRQRRPRRRLPLSTPRESSVLQLGGSAFCLFDYLRILHPNFLR